MELVNHISPDIEISTVKNIYMEDITVVRDDLLEGGTKQRGMIPFLQMLKSWGKREVVFASPFSGFAQIALAKSAKVVGVKCTIFAEMDPRYGDISHFTDSISNIANIKLCNSLRGAEERAKKYAFKHDVYKLSLGLNNAWYKTFLRSELLKQWKKLCENLGYVPPRLWVSVGSGTLANTFLSVVSGYKTKLMCVDVGVFPIDDKRIINLKKMANRFPGSLEYMRVGLDFHDPAEDEYLPPVPSNLYYDAKLWRILNLSSRNKDVWWNVAG